MKKIDRQEALDVIDEYGLCLAFANEDGKAYDTPDMAFKRKYKGY
jgi:hypothetical protein